MSNDLFRWQALYGLAIIPLITDMLETGVWPTAPRAWITEFVLAIVIAALVRRILNGLRELAHLARRDTLTGLWNRRAFVEMLHDECQRARRSAAVLTLVYLDLDHFKQVNDQRGHAAGDRLLRHVADTLQDAVRARVDRCFRLGGDEFALLLPESSAAEAESVLARVRAGGLLADAVRDIACVGLSCGIVELAADEDPDHFVRRADREMYRQKASRAPLII